MEETLQVFALRTEMVYKGISFEVDSRVVSW